jgi:hypothetical protein
MVIIGEKIFGHKVLLATGAFINFFDLLPKPLKYDVMLLSHTALMLEIEKEAALELACTLPPILYRYATFVHNSKKCEKIFHRADSKLANRCYVMPPILHEDGKYYMIAGESNGGPDEKYLTSYDEVVSWYKVNYQ